MKRLVLLLAIMLAGTAGYSAEYFHTKSIYNKIIRVQNVNSMASMCHGTFFDQAQWSYIGLDGKTYTFYYNSDNDCIEDFYTFSKKAQQYDYDICVKNGGGLSCDARK